MRRTAPTPRATPPASRPLAIQGREGCVAADSALPLTDCDPLAFMTTATWSPLCCCASNSSVWVPGGGRLPLNRNPNTPAGFGQERGRMDPALGRLASVLTGGLPSLSVLLCDEGLTQAAMPPRRRWPHGPACVRGLRAAFICDVVAWFRWIAVGSAPGPARGGEVSLGRRPGRREPGRAPDVWPVGGEGAASQRPPDPAGERNGQQQRPAPADRPPPACKRSRLNDLGSGDGHACMPRSALGDIGDDPGDLGAGDGLQPRPRHR